MWKLEFSKSAETSVCRLDKTIQEHIAKYLSKVIVSNNPRAFGKALTGNKKSLGGTEWATIELSVKFMTTNL